MHGLGILGLISGALQITVPSYSLRLVRRFGTRRVGWFVVVAFALLAMLHLLSPLKTTNVGLSVDLAFAMAAGLLVIGLGHIETVLSERQRAECQQGRMRTDWEADTEERMAGLAHTNDELHAKLADLEQSQGALRESEAAYRFLFAENPQPMWLFDLRSLRFLGVNTAALQQLGLSQDELMVLTARDLLPPAALRGFQEDAAQPGSGLQTCGRWQHCKNDRSLVEFDIAALDLRYAGQPARLILANHVGPRLQRARDFFEAQKQEVARQLTGSFAQALNDALGTISGQANYLFRHSADQTTTERLNRIAAAVNSATRLSRELLMAGGQFATQPERFDVNALLRNLYHMMHHLGGEGVVLQQAYASELPCVLADGRVIEHIVMSLVLNALDAMPGGGILTLGTAAVRVQESETFGSPAARRGDFVRLSVRDTGSGMTPEVQAHLFEPFFTTRGTGNCRGLGLASVYGAVKQLSGWIEVTTEPDVGSEFRVFLPEAKPALPPTESEFRRWIRY